MRSNSEWVLIFTIYSFLGWFCESIYCSILARKPVNRGFLTGPFCPIYGFGGLLVVTLLEPLERNLPILYVAAVILTSALEFATSLILEKLFHAKWWDYADQKFNIQGRVCLTNSLLFGLMAVVVVLFVHPSALELVYSLPRRLVPLIAAAFAVYFLCDTVATVRGVLQLGGKLAELQDILVELRSRAVSAGEERLQETRSGLESLLDRSVINRRVKALLERQKNLEQENRLMHRRLLSAFPEMISLRSEEALRRLREVLAQRKR